MPRKSGENQSARRFAVGDKLTAIHPSPLAQIVHGGRYVVSQIDLDDPMGYVWLRGITERYRPYLFEVT